MAIDPRFYTSTGAATLEDWAKATGARLVGDPSIAVTGVGAARSAIAGDVCFFEGDAKDLASISRVAAACVIGADLAGDLPSGVAALVSETPRRAHMKGAALFFALKRIGQQDGAVHSSAAIHDTAELAPGVVIGAGAAIGARTFIGANAVIGPGVQIGEACTVGSNASIQCALIGNHVTLLSGIRIGETGFGVIPGEHGAEDIPHYGRVIIQDHVSIGANTCVDRGAFDDTAIGERTKIDNFCQIAHNCQIGRNVVIAAFAGISGSVTIKDGARLGGRVGIADHVTMGRGSTLAASAGIFRDIPDGETWGGTPGKPIRQWLRETAWLQKQASGKKTSS